MLPRCPCAFVGINDLMWHPPPSSECIELLKLYSVCFTDAWIPSAHEDDIGDCVQKLVGWKKERRKMKTRNKAEHPDIHLLPFYPACTIPLMTWPWSLHFSVHRDGGFWEKQRHTNPAMRSDKGLVGRSLKGPGGGVNFDLCAPSGLGSLHASLMFPPTPFCYYRHFVVAVVVPPLLMLLHQSVHNWITIVYLWTFCCTQICSPCAVSGCDHHIVLFISLFWTTRTQNTCWMTDAAASTNRLIVQIIVNKTHPSSELQESVGSDRFFGW